MIIMGFLNRNCDSTRISQTVNLPLFVCLVMAAWLITVEISSEQGCLIKKMRKIKRKYLAHTLPENAENLTQQRFGRWTVIAFSNSEFKHGKFWLCKCQCGQESVVMQSHLKTGKSLSCGCLQREKTTKWKTANGEPLRSERKIWTGIIKRCTDPSNISFKNYGGRGIKICDEWKNDFIAFANYIGKKPSPKHEIDRINNNGNYEPGNIQWSTRSRNSRNRRSNLLFTIMGTTKTLADWVDIFSITKYTLVYKRINMGWTIEKALTKPHVKP